MRYCEELSVALLLQVEYSCVEERPRHSQFLPIFPVSNTAYHRASRDTLLLLATVTLGIIIVVFIITPLSTQL